jgi:hypothetical protein
MGLLADGDEESGGLHRSGSREPIAETFLRPALLKNCAMHT